MNYSANDMFVGNQDFGYTCRGKDADPKETAKIEAEKLKWPSGNDRPATGGTNSAVKPTQPAVSAR